MEKKEDIDKGPVQSKDYTWVTWTVSGRSQANPPNTAFLQMEKAAGVGGPCLAFCGFLYGSAPTCCAPSGKLLNFTVLRSCHQQKQ